VTSNCACQSKAAHREVEDQIGLGSLLQGEWKALHKMVRQAPISPTVSTSIPDVRRECQSPGCESNVANSNPAPIRRVR
jgi:hypothetical protein